MYKVLIVALLAVCVWLFTQRAGGEVGVEVIELKEHTVVKPTIKEYAKERVLAVFGGGWEAFDTLIYKESKWKSEAQNKYSTAYGLGQFLNGTWKTVGCVKTNDPYVQIDCAIKYVKKNYGYPQKALTHHLRVNWY